MRLAPSTGGLGLHQAVRGATAVEILTGTAVRVGCVIGFPHGNSATEVKRYETEVACRDGAVEIDMVINVGKALSGDWAYVEATSRRCAGGPPPRREVKVIFENDYLTQGCPSSRPTTSRSSCARSPSGPVPIGSRPRRATVSSSSRMAPTTIEARPSTTWRRCAGLLGPRAGEGRGGRARSRRSDPRPRPRRSRCGASATAAILEEYRRCEDSGETTVSTGRLGAGGY